MHTCAQWPINTIYFDTNRSGHLIEDGSTQVFFMVRCMEKDVQPNYLKTVATNLP